MKKKIALFGLLAAMATAAVLFIVPATGGADPGGGAVHITPDGCGIFDGNGNVFATNGKTMEVQAPDGSWLLLCKASGVPNDTGGAVTWNYDNTGSSCGSAFGETADWQETVSKSGKATVTCHFDATV